MTLEPSNALKCEVEVCKYKHTKAAIDEKVKTW
jgi:hypothetical protein